MWRIKSKILFLALGCAFFSCKKSETSVTNQSADTEPVKTDSVKEAVNPEKAAVSYRKFRGAWFDIEYPSAFRAENSLKSYTDSEGFDSAVFTSPDGKVQFYVFSPQWSGEATDIRLKNGEKITESSEQQKNGLFVKRWTVAASDGSYSRSYEETSETVSNTNKVFGIKYASKSDLENYREEYAHFKNSLQQYAD